jgi:4-hydroxy-3-polyprenylbenzoate decarboxylase
MVGITGGSGAIYAVGLLAVLHNLGYTVRVTVTEGGADVLRHECGWTLSDLAQYAQVDDVHDFFAAPASGTFRMDGMVVIPCSTSTLGKIAVGIGDNLVTRAASIMLKERKPLILVVREMPLSLPHLDNMSRLTQAGATILPPAPGFYYHPRTIPDLVAYVVNKVLDQLDIPATLSPRWEDGGTHLSVNRCR